MCHRDSCKEPREPEQGRRKLAGSRLELNEALPGVSCALQVAPKETPPTGLGFSADPAFWIQRALASCLFLRTDNVSTAAKVKGKFRLGQGRLSPFGVMNVKTWLGDTPDVLCPQVLE